MRSGGSDSAFALREPFLAISLLFHVLFNLDTLQVTFIIFKTLFPISPHIQSVS